MQLNLKLYNLFIRYVYRSDVIVNIEIANRLLQLRKENNLSQEELARKLGISRQAVSKWERAEASPDTDNLIGLARLYNVSIDELLKTDDEDTISLEAYTYESNSVAQQTESISNGYTVIEEKPSMSFSPKSTQKSIKKFVFGALILAVLILGIVIKNFYPNFPYPLLTTAIYLFIGFEYGYWHPGWLIFMTIPMYYCI